MEKIGELYDSYSSFHTHIITVISSSLMRREAHVRHTHKMRNLYIIKAGTSEGKKPLGRLQYDEKLKLKRFLKK